MATSPVVLAVRSQDAPALSTLNWAALPGAVGPAGSAVLAAGDHLIVALPEPVANRATSDALQSVLATGSSPVDEAAVTAAAAQLDALAKAGPPIQPATTTDALAQLAGGQADFTAVPVAESELADFIAANPGSNLAAVHPAGPTVGDELYGVPLTAQWVTPTLREAAAGFLAYLRSPAGQQFLVDDGNLRLTGSTPATVTTPSGAPDTAAEVQTLPDGGPAVATALAHAIGATPTG
jgi:ABC-type Fe3+ transport system substrate-binding protein